MFKRLSTGAVSGLKSFYAAAATSPFTFNVAYADDKNIASYSAGLLPVRDKRVDPRLPTKGTGKYEWKGFLSANGHPHEANPSSGELVNWNNKPAAGFGSSDSEWSYGSIHRVQMLKAGIDAKPTHDLASVVSAMNKAATQDLRDTGSFLDALTGVLDTGPPPSARAGQMEALLKAWRLQGSSRLDRDLDGKMDAGRRRRSWTRSTRRSPTRCSSRCSAHRALRSRTSRATTSAAATPAAGSTRSTRTFAS
jgi:hypothetical protein